MTIDEKAQQGMDWMCCGPWHRRSHPGFRLRIGILLVLIGSIWYGARMGWLDFAGFHAFPFWPAFVILIGAWMVYRGLSSRSTAGAKNRKEEQ